MEHISFAFGLLVYTFILFDLIILSVLWKRNRDKGILWTIILMAVFTFILIFQLVKDYSTATHIGWGGMDFILELLSIAAGLSAISLVYIVPRFSITMGGWGSWKGWVPVSLLVLCILLAIVHLLLFFRGYEYRKLSYTLIFSALGLSLLVTLSFVLFFSHKDKKKISEDERKQEDNWYQQIAVSMAKLALLMLPVFYLLDFSQFTSPWPWLNRLRQSFSGVPILCLVWNILLLRGAFKELTQFHQPANLFNLWEEWLKEKGLTEREMEVFHLLAAGDSYESIGEKLFLSKATVKSHTNRIYRKTGLENRITLLKMIQLPPKNTNSGPIQP